MIKIFIVKLSSKSYRCNIENKIDWRKIALFVDKNGLNSSKSYTLQSSSSSEPTNIEVNKISNKRLKFITLLYLILFPNINNKLHNRIIKNDLNNYYLKLWLNRLSSNWVNPKLFNIFFWFNLFISSISKKKTNIFENILFANYEWK